jgi:hypothetical protein
MQGFRVFGVKDNTSLDSQLEPWDNGCIQKMAGCLCVRMNFLATGLDFAAFIRILASACLLARMASLTSTLFVVTLCSRPPASSESPPRGSYAHDAHMGITSQVNAMFLILSTDLRRRFQLHYFGCSSSLPFDSTAC